MSILNDQEIPIGLGMALSQNLNAMQVFAAMETSARKRIIQRSRCAGSKEEMQAIVEDLLK